MTQSTLTWSESVWGMSELNRLEVGQLLSLGLGWAWDLPEKSLFCFWRYRAHITIITGLDDMVSQFVNINSGQIKNKIAILTILGQELG